MDRLVHPRLAVFEDYTTSIRASFEWACGSLLLSLQQPTSPLLYKSSLFFFALPTTATNTMPAKSLAALLSGPVELLIHSRLSGRHSHSLP